MKERGWIIVLFGVVGLGLALLYYRVLLSVIPEDSWLLDYTYGSGRRKDLLMSICLPLSGLTCFGLFRLFKFYREKRKK